MYIYTLRLEQGKFYVGTTDKLLWKQIDNDNCEWTRMYAPIEVTEIRTMKSALDEDSVTKEIMSRYGIDNVRGGSYCRPRLDKRTIHSLKFEIRRIVCRCFRCGQRGHWADTCV